MIALSRRTGHFPFLSAEFCIVPRLRESGLPLLLWLAIFLPEIAAEDEHLLWYHMFV